MGEDARKAAEQRDAPDERAMAHDGARSQVISVLCGPTGVMWSRQTNDMTERPALLLASFAAAVVVGCTPAPPRIHVELAQRAVTLGHTSRSFVPPEPMRADNDSVGVCVTPGAGTVATDNLTLRAAGAKDVKLTAQAELVGGQMIALVSGSSTGNNFCLHPDADGPLASRVRAVHLSSSEEITVTRVTWFSTAP